MSIKKYVAPTMQKALKQIREELGDDAIIVSNRKLPNGKVEISVAAEEQAPQLPNLSAETYSNARTSRPNDSSGTSQANQGMAPLQLSNEKAKQLLAAVRTNQQNEASFASHLQNASTHQNMNTQHTMSPSAPAAYPDVSALMHSTLMQLQQEVYELRNQIHQKEISSQQKIEEAIQAKANKQIDKNQEQSNQLQKNEQIQKNELQKKQQQLELKKALNAVQRRWQQIGLSDDIFSQFTASPLFQSARDTGADALWKMSLRYIKSMTPRYRRNPVESPGVYAFVGPTGAGKTTTLGKLAVRQVSRWGADQVGIVTMDSFRIGAWEQMQRLGDIIGVKTALCRQEDSLMDTLSTMRDCRFILIDSAGLSHQDERRVEQWNKLNELGDELETYLVAPANLQSSVLEQLTKAYEPANIRALIFSKCDEITRLGEAVSTVIRSELPWVFACDGQKIPDDLKVMSVDLVLQTLLTTAKLKRWQYSANASEQETLLVSALG